MKLNLPRIMITAFGSGGGKTTVTCAILKTLLDKGLNPAAFKCGPDYIDPMFHSEVLGAKSRNLDLFLLSEETCKYFLAKNSMEAQISVLEGVMGYYDGIGANSCTSSSYHLAKVTSTPVILVVNAKGIGFTITAIIKGFSDFKGDGNIKAIILNNLSEAMFQTYKEMIEKETNIKVLGYLPNIKECSIESRHLGLVSAAEVEDLNRKIDVIARHAAKSIDFEELIKIANNAPNLEYEELDIQKCEEVKIAVAKDKAFCFYYQDSIGILEKMGAKLQYFSPLEDEKLPECDGIFLGGGYPEVHAEKLSQNIKMKQSIKDALNKNTPCIAECGGFMYLLDYIEDLNGNNFDMVGFLKGKAFMTERLNRFGYVKLKATKDNLLCKKGEEINAHEFHYSDSNLNGDSFCATKPSGKRQWDCMNTGEFLYAGYPHIHFGGKLKFAYNFIEKCTQFKNRRES